MSTIKQRLSDQIKSAMKSGEKELLLYARNLHSAIRKKEIDTKVDLDDEGVVSVISFFVRQRLDSIEQFKKGNRPDLVQKEEAELRFLKNFLPEPLSDTEVDVLIDEAIVEAQATQLNDMAKVIALLAPKIQGLADSKAVGQRVRKKLEVFAPIKK